MNIKRTDIFLNRLPGRIPRSVLLAGYLLAGIGCGCSPQMSDRVAINAAYTEIFGPEQAKVKMQQIDAKPKGKSSNFQESYWKKTRMEAQNALAVAKKNRTTYKESQIRIKAAQDKIEQTIKKNGNIMLEEVWKLSVASPQALKRYTRSEDSNPKQIVFGLLNSSKVRTGVVGICLYGTSNAGARITFDRPFETDKEAIQRMGLTQSDISFVDHGGYRNYRIKRLGRRGQFLLLSSEKQVLINWSGP